jgi:hypothetical protein
MDRVWIVTRSTLKGLGWDIDKEDREGGWIRTDSRRIEGEDYGVYAKGTRQRLRVVLKGLDPGRTQVTVERRVWKQERILWMDKEQDVPAQDTKAEQQVLDAIAAALLSRPGRRRLRACRPRARPTGRERKSRRPSAPLRPCVIHGG